MAVLATLMVVVAAVVAADLLREDSGFLAATLMGISLGNQRWVDASRRIDISLTREFQETLVQLLIGVLFVLIAASVSPSDVEAVLPEAIALVLVMVLLLGRSSSSWPPGGLRLPGGSEGSLPGWPREESSRALRHLRSASSSRRMESPAPTLLPIVFVVIFATVVLYGLTAPLVARRLHVAGNSADWCSSSAAMTGRVTSPSLSRSPGPRCACGWGRRPIERPRGQRASRPTTAA